MQILEHPFYLIRKIEYNNSNKITVVLRKVYCSVFEMFLLLTNWIVLIIYIYFCALIESTLKNASGFYH